MVTTTKFCAVNDVKAYLNAADGYAGDDNQIETHIKQATALIRNYTRRVWERGTYKQYFSTQDISIAFGMSRSVAKFTLKERPVQSITSVRFHTGGDFDTVEDLTSRVWEQDGNNIIMYPSLMHHHERSIQVIYIAGYLPNGDDVELLDVAENMRQACAIQASFTWRRVINETQGKSQKQDKKGFANYSTSSSGLISEALALLKTETSIMVGSNG